jgi:hypothetical protein
MDKKVESTMNGAVSKGEAAAHCFHREVSKTAYDNVHFPNELPPLERNATSRYNPYKNKMNMKDL